MIKSVGLSGVTSDPELVAILRSDPEKGFAQLLESYGALLTNIARRFASSPEGQKDLRQEVVLKLLDSKLRSLTAWDPDRALFSSYLFMIVWRICNDYRRRVQRLKRHFESGNPGDGYQEDGRLSPPEQEGTAPSLRSSHALSCERRPKTTAGGGAVENCGAS